MFERDTKKSRIELRWLSTCYPHGVRKATLLIDLTYGYRNLELVINNDPC